MPDKIMPDKIGTDKSMTGKRQSVGARRNLDSQKAILDAAEAILSSDGLAGFSIEAVARRARSGKPTIYRWWPTRTALLLDVYKRKKNARPFPDTGTLKGDLVEFLTHQLIGFWQEGDCGTLFRSVLAQAQTQTDPETTQAFYAFAAERAAQSAPLVIRAQQRGELAETVDANLVIDMLVAFAWLRLLTGRLASAGSEVEQVVDMIIDGIKSGGSGSRNSRHHNTDTA